MKLMGVGFLVLMGVALLSGCRSDVFTETPSWSSEEAIALVRSEFNNEVNGPARWDAEFEAELKRWKVTYACERSIDRGEKLIPKSDVEVRQVEGRVEEAGHYVFNQYSSWAWVLVWYAYKTGAEEPRVIEGTSIAHPEKSLSC